MRFRAIGGRVVVVVALPHLAQLWPDTVQGRLHRRDAVHRSLHIRDFTVRVRFGQLPVLMIPSVQFQVLALTFSLTTLLHSKEPNNDWIFGGQHVQKTAENLTLMKFVLLEA